MLYRLGGASSGSWPSRQPGTCASGGQTAARQRVAREPPSARHAPGTQTWRAATDAGAWPLEPQQPSQAPERAQRRRWEPRREEAAHASRERWALRASVAVAHAPRGTAAMPRASCSSHSRSSNVQCAASPMVCGGRKQRSVTAAQGEPRWRPRRPRAPRPRPGASQAPAAAPIRATAARKRAKSGVSGERALRSAQ